MIRSETFKFIFINLNIKIIILSLLYFYSSALNSQSIINKKIKYDNFVLSIDKNLIDDFDDNNLNAEINNLPDEIKNNFKSDILFDFNEFKDVFYYKDIQGYISDFSIIFSVAYLDLNNDGVNEIIVDYNTRTSCGVSGFCMFYIFERNNDGWTNIGEVHSTGLNFFVIDEIFNNYYSFILKTAIYGKRICRFSDRVNEYRCAEVNEEQNF